MTATGDTATSKLELIMGRDGLARLADSTVMVLGVVFFAKTTGG